MTRTMAAAELQDIPVAGGSLRTAVWGRQGPVVLCAHGLTANHTEFQALADQLGPDVRLIAPDLRGRGHSNAITGPWGMSAHAADMIAVLDHFGIAKVDVLLGHSMGGFVAAVAAAQHPQRIGTVMMVDGGVPIMNLSFLNWMPFSGYLTQKIVRKIVGPSLARLDMTFESRDSYRQHWRAHPALAADWSHYVERYIDYDLEGEAPQLRSATRKDALWADIRTQLVEDLVPRALSSMRSPVRFLRAEFGMVNGAPLYSEKQLSRASAGVQIFSSRTLPGVNHFTILISERGATVVADELRALLATC